MIDDGSHDFRPEADDHRRRAVLQLLRQRGLPLDPGTVDAAVAVLAAAERVWEPDVALIWLQSPNAGLDHVAPVDVVAVRGPVDVVAATERELAGAY